MAQPGALVAGIWRHAKQVADGALHAVCRRERQGEIGELRVFGIQRQGQADQGFRQIKGDVQGVAVLRIAVAFVAAPQRDQPAFGFVCGAAEFFQLAGGDAGNTSTHGVVCQRSEIDGLVEKLHLRLARLADQSGGLPVPFGKIGRNPQAKHEHQPEVHENRDQSWIVRERLDGRLTENHALHLVEH